MPTRPIVFIGSACIALIAGLMPSATSLASTDASTIRPPLTSGSSAPGNSDTGLVTFTYTGGPQDWLIPRGVQSVYATLVGGPGGVGNVEDYYQPRPPAAAAQVSGTLTWPSGTFALDLWVGGVGGDATGTKPSDPSPGTPGAGGWNGGASGGTGSEGSSSGGGGGGATDIRIGGYLPDTRVMVAGGGGGQGGIDFAQCCPFGEGLGGTGGVGTAVSGVWAGGDGGTAQGDNGGRGGSGGWNPGGQATPGGDAGTATNNGGGGGGGGGWFGGEGGGAGRSGLIGDSAPGGGGGGGSSYAEPGLVTNATATLADLAVPPQAQIAWVDLSSTSMPDLQVGASVEGQLTASFGGASSPLSWNVVGGRLPAGVSLSPTGSLSGVPTQTGFYEFTVSVAAQPGDLATSIATLRGTVRPGTPAPSVPTSVTATGGVGAATVTWSPPAYPGTSAVTNYRVRWSSDTGQTWSAPVAVPVTQTTYTASLAGGASYLFQVAAVNATSTGAWSTSSNAATVTSATSAPTNVTGVPGYESIALTWLAPSITGGSPVTGYSIRYSTDAGGSWAQMPNTGSSATSATVTGLTSQAGYLFEVAAINAAGVSAWSQPSPLTFPEIDPGAPSDVVGVSGYQSVELTWLAPPSSVVPITGYQVRYSDDSGMTWSQPVATGSTALTFDYTGLTRPDFLVFQVAAINTIGSSAWSAPSAPVSPETRPSPPTRVRVLSEDRAVTLTWAPPADLSGGTLSGYRIDVRTDPRQPWRVHTATTGTTATRYRIEDLVNGVQYEFRLTAISQFGVGLPSQPVNATPFGVPGLVSGVTAVAGNATATITWQPPRQDNGRPVLGYRIEAAATTGWYLITDNTASTATTYAVTGLINGQAYLFRVSAINLAGAGSPSVPSSPVTPSATTPSAPRKVEVTQGSGRVLVAWQAPRTAGDEPISSFVVETSVAGGPWSVQCQTAALECRITGLSTSTPYRFRVAALSSAGQGEWSSPSLPVTPGVDPTRPAITKVSVTHHQAVIVVASTWLGQDRLQYSDTAGVWREITDGRITLGRGVAGTSVRALHRDRVSPPVWITVDRPRDTTARMSVSLRGERSTITGIDGHDLRWRYNRSMTWKRVTPTVDLTRPRPPRPWTLRIRDFTRSVTVAIQIR